MKKLVTLLAAAGMIVSAAAPASAVDVKVDARYRLSFATGDAGFVGQNKEDMRHRLRLGLTMAASENLSAYVQFQVNHGNQWGNTTQHGNTGKSDDITARMMYLDWTVPGTPVKVRMGRHQFGLPAEAFGQNSILGAGWGNREGIIVTAPVTDWLGLTAMWARLATDSGTDLDQNQTDDMYAVAANLKFDGISGAVYGAYATLDGQPAEAKSVELPTFTNTDGEEVAAGKVKYTYQSAANTTWNGGRPKGEGKAWWAGFTTTVSMFDPFVLKLSAAYGEFESDTNSKYDQDGWNVQAKASYKTAYGTPVLGGWYFSGADKGEYGAMPNSGYFAGTKYYYDGFAALNSNLGNANNMGTWAVQTGIEGVSFLEGLTHDFHVTYMEGTNDAEANLKFLGDKNAFANYLTEDDSLVEISLANYYKLYKNLTARLELAYIIADIEDRGEAADPVKFDEDNWFAGLTFDFQF